MSQSERAQFKQRIVVEYEATPCGLASLAEGPVRYQAITQKRAKMQHCQTLDAGEDLFSIVASVKRLANE
jgi:hypothetical protein